ncbi:hypothetical protein C0989_011356 [Termitomyces sp. Mn162]|nr:hypothetical protein C0989_011356 [Termitomyces sp. Mn162]KAH0586127.1 hypothetical protein H2248_007393 [Termitomyces sp. 'cryptogamus']
MSIDLSLDRLRRFVQYLPPYTRPTFHIAGTNGKGSVSAILTSILCSSTPSLSVGRYNSPHLVSIHDCISINDSTIDAATYSDARSRIEYLDQVHGTKLSKFELLTLTALSIFEKAKVDVVVLEVGMGGRLDATNIIPDESVIVSALTSVDLDHQSFLGTTVAEIAREKAGIARKGRVFVLGPQKHPEVLEAVQDVIRNIGGELVTSIAVARRDWDGDLDAPVQSSFSMTPTNFNEPPPTLVAAHMPCFPHDIRATLPLFGDHQLENLGVALTAISALLTHPSAHINIVKSISPKTISRGIQSVRWPGRLSFHLLPAKPKHGITRPLIVLADGAHNSASSATLGSYITHLLSLADVESPVNLTYILSLSHSPPKTPLQTLTPILPPTLPSQSSLKIHVRIACLRFTPPDEMPWVKSVAPEDLRDAVASLTPEAEIWVADGVVGNQLHHALEWAAKENGDGLVVVAGSLYLVADLYRFLQQEKIKVL